MIRLIIETHTGGLLVIPGLAIHRVKIQMDSETEEWLTVADLPDLDALARFIEATGGAHIYSNPGRWGAHWPQWLRCMFATVDDAPLGRQNVTILEDV
jgi:hypothetical protein